MFWADAKCLAWRFCFRCFVLSVFNRFYQRWIENLFFVIQIVFFDRLYLVLLLLVRNTFSGVGKKNLECPSRPWAVLSGTERFGLILAYSAKYYFLRFFFYLWKENRAYYHCSKAHIQTYVICVSMDRYINSHWSGEQDRREGIHLD